jgi:alanyl-tRNA synthetase
MAEELGLGVNDEQFEEAQQASREASKASTKKGSVDVVRLDVHDLAVLEKDVDVPKTDDSAKFRTSTIFRCPLDGIDVSQSPQ